MKDIDLKNLSILENLSKRTIKVCLENNLASLNLILEYYINSNQWHFRYLEGCGIKSNKELEQLCEKYLNKKDESTEIVEIYKNLSERKKNLVSLYFIISTNNENRSIKKELYSFSNTLDIFQILEKSFSILFNSKINDIYSKKKYQKLYSIISSVINFIVDVENFDELDTIKIENELNLKRFEKAFPDEIFNYIRNCCYTSNSLNVFTSIDYMIEKNIIYKQKNKIVFDYIYRYPLSSKATNKEIGDELSITGEAARIKKKSIKSNFNKNFSFIKFLNLNKYLNLGLSINNYENMIDENFVININTEEKVNFNRIFYLDFFNFAFRY